ncbi:nucleosome assembly protein 1;3-like [Hibiscus syriacus]|uniref:nucleosome assembly protein 1;3-like n=1 Tax=Hibiscus syriacus TaxID=106335 RepID=UPI001921085D|nr:nucleosome assembly protein 1;3-like [Hibiscus syriacus]
MSNAGININISDLGDGLNEEARAGGIDDLTDEIQSLAMDYTDELETFSPNVRKRVEVLKEIQVQHDELEAKFFEEMAALEAKYQELYKPFYAKRYGIVNGVGEADRTTNDVDMDQKEDNAIMYYVEKGVPYFWLIAMKNSEELSEKITEHDAGVLKYLEDIKWHRIHEPKGFKLEFYFHTNPYFKNTLLTKTFHVIEEGDPVLDKAIGTEIEWYPGKCLILEKKPENGSMDANPTSKTEDSQSFFKFFYPPEVPDDVDDIDKDTAEELHNLMEQDYDMGVIIRDKIIPRAVSWFTGEAVYGEYFYIDDDDDDCSDYDDDDDSSSEEEDEEARRCIKKVYDT